MLVVCPVALRAQATGSGFDGRRPGAEGAGVTRQDGLIAGGQLGVGLDHLSSDLPLNERLGSHAPFAHWNGRLSYDFSRRRGSVTAGLDSSGRYFPEFSRSVVASTSGQFGVSARVAPRTLFAGRLDVSRRPVSALSIESGLDLAELPVDFGAGTADYRTAGGEMQLTQELTRRSSVTLSVGLRRVDSTGRLDDQRSRQAFLRYTHALTSSLGIRIGYGRGEHRYDPNELASDPAGRRVDLQMIDAGIDFNRTLSLSRRTTLGIGTGSTITADGGQSRFNLVGDARLLREFGRTWQAGLTYSRSVDFLDVLGAPSLVDGVRARVGGMIGRDVTLVSYVGASRALTGFVRGGDSAFVTYRAGSSLSAALGRRVSLRTDYTASFYRFDNPQQVPDGLSGASVRYHSIRVGLDVWAPVWSPARRP